MAEETWRIILQQDMSGGGAEGEPAGSGGSQQGETPQQRKQLFEDAGKVFGAIAGVSSILAILIRTMQESTVFSTFMNAFIKVISAIFDLILVSVIPVLMVVLRWLLSFLPIAQEIGQYLKPFMEKVATWLEQLLTDFTKWVVPTLKSLVDAVTKLFGSGDVGPLMKWFEKLFADVGKLAGDLFMNAMKWLEQEGPKIIDSFGKIVTGFVEWLNKNGSTITSNFVNAIKVTQETLTPLWNRLVEVLGPIFEQLFEPVKTYLLKVGKWIEDEIFAPIGAWYKDIFMPWMGTAVKGLVDYIGALFKNEIDIMGHYWNIVMSEVLTHLLDPKTAKLHADERKAEMFAEHANKIVLKIPELEGIKWNADMWQKFPQLINATNDQTKILADIRALSMSMVAEQKETKQAVKENYEADSMTNPMPRLTTNDPSINQVIKPDTNRWKTRMGQMEAAGTNWW